MILGIETSCDETAAAIVALNRGRIRILSNVVASQVELHAKTKGIVPEVAAREHIKTIVPVLKNAMGKKAWQDLDGIAATHAPGLITSLLVGVETAKTLSWTFNKPLLAVNHLEGHILANWLPGALSPKVHWQAKIPLPAIILIVSGGHTALVLMEDFGKYKTLGQTLDDAAGEAFDKVAKLLDLGYPGGPVISKLAQKGKKDAFDFPRPMIDKKNYDFSFSGLKTSVLYTVKKLDKKNLPINDICASFEQAVADTLVLKTLAAAKEFKPKSVLLAGGVAANQRLRQQMKRELKKQFPKTYFSMPALEYCTDNAAMIALAGVIHFKKKNVSSWKKVTVESQRDL